MDDCGYNYERSVMDDEFHELEIKTEKLEAENKKLRDLITKFIDNIENRDPQSFLMTILGFFIKDCKQVLEDNK